MSGRAAALLRPPGVGGWTRAGLGAGSRLGNARRCSGTPGELVIPGLSVPVLEGSGPPRARALSPAFPERPRRDPGGHHGAPALPLERPRPAVGWESGMGSEHVDKQGNVR